MPDNGWKPIQAKHRILVGLVHSNEVKDEKQGIMQRKIDEVKLI